MIVEDGEKCVCGGVIDKRVLVSQGVWQGKCFQCGRLYQVVEFKPSLPD
jgi:hypothetical protein